MTTFLFTVILSLSLLSLELFGSVIRNKSKKVKEGLDKNSSKTFHKTISINLNSSEGTTKSESKDELYDELTLNKIEEFLKKQMMTSEKYPDVINDTNSGQSSSRNNYAVNNEHSNGSSHAITNSTQSNQLSAYNDLADANKSFTNIDLSNGSSHATTNNTQSKQLSAYNDLVDANKSFTNIDLSNGSLHATVNLKPLFTLDDGSNKRNYSSKSETTAGNLDKPLSISINLLVGNNVTIRKYYLYKNLTKKEQMDSFLPDEDIKINESENNLDLMEDDVRRNNLGKKIDCERINNISKMINFINSKKDQTNSSTFSLSGTKTNTLKNTTELNSIKEEQQQTFFEHSIPVSSHYVDVDESGVEIGSPITFFPQEVYPTEHATMFLLQLVRRKKQSLTDSDSEIYNQDLDTNDFESQVMFFPTEGNVEQDDMVTEVDLRKLVLQ